MEAAGTPDIPSLARSAGVSCLRTSAWTMSGVGVPAASGVTSPRSSASTGTPSR